MSKLVSKGVDQEQDPPRKVRGRRYQLMVMQSTASLVARRDGPCRCFFGETHVMRYLGGFCLSALLVRRLETRKGPLADVQHIFSSTIMRHEISYPHDRITHERRGIPRRMRPLRSEHAIRTQPRQLRSKGPSEGFFLPSVRRYDAMCKR